MRRSDFIRFSKKLTLFFVLPFCVWVYLELKVKQTPDSYLIKREAIERLAPNLELLVLGNSHAYYGIKPSVFSVPSYSLANVNQTVDLDVDLMLKYVDQLPKLKYVVQSLSLFSLGFRMSEHAEEWRQYFYTYYFGVTGQPGFKNYFHPKSWSLTLALGRDLTWSRIQESEGWMGFVKGLDDHGWYGRPGVDADMLNTAISLPKVRREQESINPRDQWDDAKRRLTLMASRLKEHGVQLIITISPAYPTYFKAFDPELVRSFYAAVEQLCKETSAKCVNYNGDKRLVAGDFFDLHHLNQGGADKYSRILDQEVIQKLTATR